ncbi:polyprenol monophosphomannose synthase [Kiritimatiella glycovorans]|uniref:Glycosyltransferase CsbB n=1 Tax=Kiritimatiella glycovorans TaxID=1307763 RepID=A0A0G3EDD1_9BACT|nr:polyprenol monophosphomannose synthase [Kiritimatiella glycovorans]AKJ63377.1 Putative glycosyltransferase CsbB [Kiritimatiella glycovorans]
MNDLGISLEDSVIVVPTFNERQNVRPLAAEVFRHYPDAHLLFVDDSSPDGTGELLDEMSADDERVHVLHRADKNGLGRAYIAGFKWALERAYEFVFEMDADFSHSPEELGELRRGVEDADLALGSRYVGGIRIINWPLNRLILSRSAGVYTKLVTGMPFTDPTGGFKCFRRRLLKHFDLDRIESNGYGFQIELTYRAWMDGFRVTEVPITFVERRSGESKMSTAIIREAFLLVWRLLIHSRFRRRPRA